MRSQTLCLVALAALGGLAALGSQSADDPAPAGRDTRSPDLQQLIPRWELGDSWIVETVSRPLQTRAEADPDARCKPIQWQFAVARFEKALTDDCYRLEIKCLAEGPQQPTTVVWVDKESRAIRQIQTQIPTPDGFQTVTQSYEFASGQPSPVLGPISALPLDLPLFSGGGAKGKQTYMYETHTGTPGVKEVGELGFAHQVEQEVQPVENEQVKGLVHETYTKSLTNDPVVEVQLKSGPRQVRQLWQPGLPWPVYSKNSSTECRLVKVIPADHESDR